MLVDVYFLADANTDAGGFLVNAAADTVISRTVSATTVILTVSCGSCLHRSLFSCRRVVDLLTANFLAANLTSAVGPLTSLLPLLHIVS